MLEFQHDPGRPAMGAVARGLFFVNARGRSMKRRRLLEAEERNSLALGAMDALADLIAGLDPHNHIDPGKFYYLFQVVNRAVHDAIRVPTDAGGRASNDDER
jgi:hypothetical protein